LKTNHLQHATPSKTKLSYFNSAEVGLGAPGRGKSLRLLDLIAQCRADKVPIVFLTPVGEKQLRHRKVRHRLDMAVVNSLANPPHISRAQYVEGLMDCSRAALGMGLPVSRQSFQEDGYEGDAPSK